MNLEELLQSLSDAERDFIASLDYGNDANEHRSQLDHVIAHDGVVDMQSQLWFPYEVIELGKNHLQEGHEREFVACLGIVLKNIILGHDQMTRINSIKNNPYAPLDRLSTAHRTWVESLICLAEKKS